MEMGLRIFVVLVALVMGYVGGFADGYHAKR